MGLKQWLGYATDELVSPLPIDQCVSRLRAAAEEGGGGIFGGSRVVGTVGENSLRLRKRLKNARNSFQTFLSARLASDGMLTRLTCRFGPHLLVMIFMLFWLGIVITAALGTLTFGLRESAGGQVPSAGLIVPWIMVVGGVVLVGVGRTMARGERQFLLDFLRETIDARPIAASPQSSTVERR